jgi:cell division protease FtsH
MPPAMEHCHRPWWKRPPFWFIGIAAVSLLIVFATEQIDKPVPTPYSAFLDQLEAGNVASVAFQGTQIDGRYKRALDGAPSSGAKAPRDTFRSRVPDFGDPTLIPELRKQHVVIDVESPSQWTSLLARLPWPMLLFIGVAIAAGFVRLMRGGSAQSGTAAAAFPAHGMMGLVSRLFGKRDQAAVSPTNDSDEPKSR